MATERQDNGLGYTLIITGAPYITQAPATALSFARALLKTGRRIDRIFLYGDGVALASSLVTPPSDENNWSEQWLALIQEHDIRAVVCIASALRRGLLDERESKRYQRPTSNLAENFIIAGLGEWVEALQTSDRVVYFHGGD